MAQFYVLDYLGGGRGVPAYVDGVLDEWFKAPWNDYAPGAERHYGSDMPFTLSTKHRLIDFDYADVHSLFIASEVFLERMAGASCDVLKQPLRVWAGKNEMVQKRFFLLRVQDRLWCMDEKLSAYQIKLDPETGEPRYRAWAPSRPNYARIDKLVIDEEKTNGKDLFFCEEALRHVVTDRLASRLDGLKGVRLTPTAEYKFPVV
jgi:hypothetical protein